MCSELKHFSPIVLHYCIIKLKCYSLQHRHRCSITNITRVSCQGLVRLLQPCFLHMGKWWFLLQVILIWNSILWLKTKTRNTGNYQRFSLGMDALPVSSTQEVGDPSFLPWTDVHSNSTQVVGSPFCNEELPIPVYNNDVSQHQCSKSEEQYDQNLLEICSDEHNLQIRRMHR